MPTADQAALGSVSILFNAAALVAGQFSQPFQAQIQGQDPVTAAASSVDIVTLDATLEEMHSYTAEVTEHPVEQGADITDHVRPKPVEIRMRGVVSNTPLGSAAQDLANNIANAAALVGVTSLLSAQNADISKQTFATLTKLSQAGNPCILYTKFRTYDSMVMTSLEVTRDQRTGSAIAFTASFRQITTVESATATVTLPAVAQATVNSGAQGTIGASSGVRTQSLAVQAMPGLAASMAAKEAAAGAVNPYSGNIP